MPLAAPAKGGMDSMDKPKAVLFAILLALFAMTHATAQTSSGERWYAVSEIGMHVVNPGIPLEALDAGRARQYFAGDFLLNWPRPADLEARRVAALEQLRRIEPHLIAAGDPRPFAAVERFSRSRAVVRVYLTLGGFRWHRYFHDLARYEIARESAIDAALNLPQLERKLGGTWRGLGHGSTAADLLALLGAPDQEHPSQALSLRNLYYARDDLHVEIHDGVVYYLEHGKPGWLQPVPPPGAGPAHGPAPR